MMLYQLFHCKVIHNNMHTSHNFTNWSRYWGGKNQKAVLSLSKYIPEILYCQHTEQVHLYLNQWNQTLSTTWLKIDDDLNAWLF